MILQKLIMKNFRQFRGTQQIEFAAEIGEKGKNVTVIFGGNGRGKTGIFRAITFCLYGESRLSQDEDVTQKDIYLVNSAEIQELSRDNKPAECFVELDFRHNEDRYTIKRSLAGMIDGEERIEQYGKVEFSHMRPDGNTQNISDPDEIRKIINDIMDKNVKDYFFFDGERIQRLTLANIEQRREIAKGIKNLLNIDALEKAIKAIQRLKKTLNIEIGNNATGEYGRTLKLLNDKDEERNGYTRRLQQLEEEYVHAETERKQIDKKFEAYKEIAHLVKDRSAAEGKIKLEEDNAQALLLEMKTKVGKASLLLMSETIDSVFASIDQRKQKGEIPSEIRKDLIEKIIESQECLCKREVLPGTEPFKQIILWRNKSTESELEGSALNMWRYLSSMQSHRGDVYGSMETLLQKYGVCKNEIEKLRSKIEDLNNQIGAPRSDAAELESHRENIIKKQIKVEAERLEAEDGLKDSVLEYERLFELRKKLERQEGVKNELSQRSNLAEDTSNALQNIYNEFTNEIKQRIAEEANKYFDQLLDVEGRKTLKRILVNDDYSLQILDRWGKPFLANISAGQRQIMSISFITALAKVASADKILEMPLFMDTPFGRLSSEHRKNLVERIPTLCSQWILLATDTEFRKQEAFLLVQSKRWDKFYTLQCEEPCVTTIQERNIMDAQSILSDALEEK